MPQFKSRDTKRAQRLRNAATEAERKLWRHLSRRQLGGFKFSRQIPVGPYVCDFLCRERGRVVEVDGGQHADRIRRDGIRTAYLEREGLKIFRFWNNEVQENSAGVLQVILAALEQRAPRFTSPFTLAGAEEPRSGEGVGLNDAARAHPQPPPASGRGLA